LLVVYGAKYSPAIRSGEWWRLITPILLHGGLVHIAFNMYALFSIGPQLEKTYGHLRFLALYLIGGFTGNVLSFIFSPGISVGSSTAIFGLLAAEGIFVYQNRRFFGGRSQSILLNVIGIALINLLIGQTVPGIDNWGHMGGLLGGALFAWFAGPVWEVQGVPPNLQIVDRRDPLQVQLVGIAILILFGGLAVYFTSFG
jgi:rhomboid protease GluP